MGAGGVARRAVSIASPMNSANNNFAFAESLSFADAADSSAGSPTAARRDAVDADHFIVDEPTPVLKLTSYSKRDDATDAD